jgi:hypothetical protein
MGTRFVEGGWLRALRIALLLALATACLHAAPSNAAIPGSERQALIAIYEATHGGAWVDNSNWCTSSPCPLEAPTFAPPGSECFSGTPGSGWYGIVCNAERTHVVGINLSANHLTGSLPSIAPLSAMQDFMVSNNELCGTLPDLGALTELRTFAASANRFSGSIPDLAAFASLESFLVAENALTGSLPSLDGLDALESFDAGRNRLTGAIPPVAGHFALVHFDVSDNALTGPIPDLVGLDSLSYFFVDGNRLEGAIPPLAGILQLRQFLAAGNRLSGTIPELPSGLLRIDVSNNRLTGALPAPPSSLWTNASRLCPNPLDVERSGNDAGWNAATGTTPWWAGPSNGATCDDLLAAGFEAP